MVCKRCLLLFQFYIAMGSSMSMCSSCLGGGQSNNSPYSYEVFNRMPFFGSLSNYLRIFKGGGMGGRGSSGMLSNILNQFGGGGQGGFGGLLPSGGGGMGPGGPGYPSPGGGGFPSIPGGFMPGGQGGPDAASIFKILNIRNLNPVGHGSAKDSVFDLVNNDTFVRKIKKSNYSEIAKKLEGTGQQFSDPEFPPNQSSLGNLRAHETNPSTITWRRVPEFLSNPMFIKDEINPADIIQGELGDCYLLSALSALAEQGYRIKNLFPSIEINPNGIYMARILHNGEYQEVIIDDYFPVKRDSNRAAFAQPAGGQEIWVLVLEKCWAKLYGSYANIIGGLPSEVLHALSSAPAFYNRIPSDPNRQEDLWQRMLRDQTNGALLACGTKADPEVENFGFVSGHAYTILGVYDKPARLLKLRNPWGHKEWKGRASDYDLDFWNQISATDKQLLDYEDISRKTQKDGIFFILWEDFLKYFQLVEICKLNDNAHYNFVPAEFQNLQPQLFEFELRNSAPSLMTIAITQKDKRGTKRGYSRNIAALGRYNSNTQRYEYVQSKSGKSFPDNYLEVENALSGKYVLYTKYIMEGKNSDSGIVSIYSMSPAMIAEAQNISPDKFLNDIMYDHASKNPRKKIIEGPNDWLCSDILLNAGGFSYFVANSDSPKKYGVTINESEYTNRRLVLQGKYRGCSTVKEEVSTGRPCIVVAELQEIDFPSSISNPTPTVVPLQ